MDNENDAPTVDTDDMIGVRMGAWVALCCERDSLAARLATLAAAGITTGEDGAVRFHGLSGAEIEGMQRDLTFYRRKLGERNEQMWRLQQADPDRAALVRERDDALILFRVNKDERVRLEGIIAAAAGRGADGEAT